MNIIIVLGVFAGILILLITYFALKILVRGTRFLLRGARTPSSK